MSATFANRKVYYYNYSGCKGIHWDKFRCKWCAKISTKGQTLFLGRFKDFDDAVEVREKGEAAISLLKSMDASSINILIVENGNKIISGTLPKNGFNFKLEVEIDLPRTSDFHGYYYTVEDLL